MMSLEKRNSLYVNSFPRTGNTYLQQSLQRFIYNNNLNVELFSHDHDHLLLLNPFINQVAILRDPTACVSSFILMYLSPNYESSRSRAYSEMQDLIDDNLMLYVNFITNMLISKNVAILRFEDLSNKDINSICVSILKYFSLVDQQDFKFLSERDISDNESLNNKKHSSDIYLLNYPKDYSLIPERDTVISLIRSSKNFDLALDAYQEIYKRLDESVRFLTFS